jgi:Xaa-Pro aminopeptidase
MNYRKRINNLQNELKKRKIDGLLVSNPKNIFYLSGLFEKANKEVQSCYDLDGFLIVTAETVFALADSRNIETFNGINPIKAIEVVKPFSFKGFTKQIADLGISKLGIEQNHLLYAEGRELVDSKLEIHYAEDIILNLREKKDQEEVKIMQKAAKITDECFRHIVGKIKPGMTEGEVAKEINMYFYTNADGPAFETIVASGANTAIPHHLASDKMLKTGEAVLLDFGAKIKGYSADMTRTVFIGKASDRQKEVYRTVLEAQMLAFGELAQTSNILDLHKKIVGYFEKKGFKDNFVHALSHGIGLDVHEEPYVSENKQLEVGMAFSVEPGLYFPQWGGVRIEDCVINTEGGFVALTKSNKEIIEIRA